MSSSDDRIQVAGKCKECGGSMSVRRVWVIGVKQIPACNQCGLLAIPAYVPFEAQKE